MYISLPSQVPIFSAESSGVSSNTLGNGIIHGAATAEESSVVISENGTSLSVAGY